MCLAIPSRVERIEGLSAVVVARGERREVSLMLLDEGVEVGDYVLVQQGRFAYERLDATDAQQALALIDSIIEDHGGSDLRAWQGR